MPVDNYSPAMSRNFRPRGAQLIGWAPGYGGPRGAPQLSTGDAVEPDNDGEQEDRRERLGYRSTNPTRGR